MPFALALLASAVVHVAALLGPAWSLPGQGEPETPQTLDAVLTRPAAALAAPKQSAPAKPAPEKSHLATSPVPAPPVPFGEAQPGSVSEPAAVPVAAAPGPVPEALRPVAIALPASGRVRYVITKGESGVGMVVGQSVHTWEHDGMGYKLQSVSETTGIAAFFKPVRVVQASQGEVVATGLRPQAFRHERAGGVVDTAAFDWERRALTYGGREESLNDGTQDMLSMYYQLALGAANPTFAAHPTEMPIATGRKLERYRFDVIGVEQIVLSGAEHRAIHLSTQSGSDRIDVWLATDGYSLPLKIRFIDRQGEIFDQLVDEFKSRESP